MLRVLAAVLAGEGALLDVDAPVGHARAALAKPAVPGLGTANSVAAYSCSARQGLPNSRFAK